MIKYNNKGSTSVYLFELYQFSIKFMDFISDFYKNSTVLNNNNLILNKNQNTRSIYHKIIL